MHLKLPQSQTKYVYKNYTVQTMTTERRVIDFNEYFKRRHIGCSILAAAVAHGAIGCNHKSFTLVWR